MELCASRASLDNIPEKLPRNNTTCSSLLKTVLLPANMYFYSIINKLLCMNNISSMECKIQFFK